MPSRTLRKNLVRMLPSSALPARRLRKMLSPLMEEAARDTLADRYRKKFSARAHAWMLIAHTMSANQSLWQSHAQQQADPAHAPFLGMEEESISYSQLARSSTSRPLSSSKGCSPRSCARSSRTRGGADAPSGRGAAPLGGRAGSWTPPSSPCAKLSPWGVWNKRGNSGVRLQTLLDPSDRLPTRMELELLSTNDANALGSLDLSGLEGMTLIFDLGYYCSRPLWEAHTRRGSLPNPPKGPGLLRGNAQQQSFPRGEPYDAPRGTWSSPTRPSPSAAPTTVAVPSSKG